jgi:hypothetical protein
MSTESNIRRKAIRQGYVIRKSRQQFVPNIDNHGEYMLVDAYSNLVALGERFDATLEDIDAFLGEGDEAPAAPAA